jgi:hypothetical protein
MEEKLIKEEKEAELQNLARTLEQLKKEKQEKAKLLANCMTLLFYFKF